MGDVKLGFLIGLVLGSVALSSVAGVQVNSIPFKGTAAQRTDLLGGHLDIGVISAGEIAELHGGKSGQQVLEIADERNVVEVSPIGETALHDRAQQVGQRMRRLAFEKGAHRSTIALARRGATDGGRCRRRCVR